MNAHIPHTDYTKRIVLIDTLQTVDPRLQRRRVILDSFDSDPLTKEQAHELYTELAEIEVSLQSEPAEPGIHVIVSGGEVLELGPQTGHEEIPF